jgi:hypothetical protein
MPDNTEPIPFVQGMAPFAWKPNRAYRVYILPGELIFIYTGSGGEISAAVGAQFGLIGGLLAAALSRKKDEPSQEPADAAALEEILRQHKHSFRAQASDILEASLDPYSFWLAAMYHQPGHVGALRFRHRDQGKLTLCFNTLEDMRTALEKLPAALGDSLTVNVEWDENKKRFVRKSS